MIATLKFDCVWNLDTTHQAISLLPSDSIQGTVLLLASVYPVLNLDVLDVLEVVNILRHHNHLLGHGGAAYQQVELTRRPTALIRSRTPNLSRSQQMHMQVSSRYHCRVIARPKFYRGCSSHGVRRESACSTRPRP